MTKKEALFVIKNAAFLGTAEDAAKVEKAIDTLEGNVQEKPMDGLISRQAAIDAIEHRLAEPAYQHTGEDWYVGMNCAESELYELPSVQPERPKGKWNTYYHSDTEFTYSCNSCGYSAPYQVLGGEVVQKKWNFCPNCGADMRRNE